MMKNRIIVCLVALCVAMGVWAQEPAVLSPTPGDGEPVFEVVEVQPQFPGGLEGLKGWLAGNLKYPKQAMEKGAGGRVLVQFVVNKDGKVVEPKILRSGEHPSLDKEALRLVKKMPNWTPGRKNGQPVRVRFTLPITFRLN